MNDTPTGLPANPHAAPRALHTVIVGTGCHIPAAPVLNDSFLTSDFCDAQGRGFDKPNAEVIALFAKITDIHERRHTAGDRVTSDIACLAAQDALESYGIDPETLDCIILAHNFGDIRAVGGRSELVPSLAARVKQKLGIRNPDAVAYDIIFGCPGWLQGLIQADYYLRSGDARRALVIGADTLSRVCDPHDRDSMIYADGAGAVVLEAQPADAPVGVLAHVARSDAVDHAALLRMGPSNRPANGGADTYLKMDGRAVYEYAIETVPKVVKACLDKAGLALADVDKFLIHQANAKMDEAILKRVGRLYGVREMEPSVMPMTISWLGNSSVATIPTLLDLLCKGRLPDHAWRSGGNYVLASVGAGMNVNAVAYRCP
jgi:3-oxoacyl-[acyl-carrier-protein] synthase III